MSVWARALVLASVVYASACDLYCRPGDCSSEEGYYCGSKTGQCRQDCVEDSDCRRPLECRDSPEGCPPAGQFCNHGRCAGTILPGVAIDLPYTPGSDERPPAGFEDAPLNSAPAFVISALSILPPGRGLDLDDKCRDPAGHDCIDNNLGSIGSQVNAAIGQGLTGGATLLVLQLAGAVLPIPPKGILATLKIYTARDVDAQSTNNFGPSGACCELNIFAGSLVANQAATRVPVWIKPVEGGYSLQSKHPAEFRFALTLGTSAASESLHLRSAFIIGRLDPTLSTLNDGVIGGALEPASLSVIANPFHDINGQVCPAGGSILDCAARYASPDIDVDADGLESFSVNSTGRVAECIDGDGTRVPPVDSARAYSCAQVTSRMVDGYSIAFGYSAVRAKLLGISN